MTQSILIWVVGSTALFLIVGFILHRVLSPGKMIYECGGVVAGIDKDDPSRISVRQVFKGQCTQVVHLNVYAEYAYDKAPEVSIGDKVDLYRDDRHGELYWVSKSTPQF